MSYDPYGKSDPYAVATPAGSGYNPAAPAPQKMDAAMGTPGDISFLAGKKRIFLKQRFEAMEALANAVGFGVIEFKNKYDFFDADSGEPLLYAAEESGCFCRACCKPNHTAKLHVFDVRPGMGQTPLFTMDKPFTLNCCVCHEICAQKQTTKIVNTETIIGSSTKHVPCGGCFTPIIDVKGKEGNQEFTVKGPTCIVGGLIELCMDQQFNILDKNGVEAGRIVHMKPKQGMEGLQEAVGDSDRYLVELINGTDAEKTANLISTLLLLDYMFFESGPPCQFVGGKLEYNCFNAYCCGCILPCAGQCGGGSTDVGGGGFGGAAAKDEIEI